MQFKLNYLIFQIMYPTAEMWAYRTNCLKEAFDLWLIWSSRPEIHFIEKNLIDTIFDATRRKILEIYNEQNFTENAFFDLTDLILALQKALYELCCRLNYI